MAVGAAIAATFAKIAASAIVKKIVINLAIAVATTFVAKQLGLFKPPKIGKQNDPGVKIQLPPSTDNKVPLLYGRNLAGGIITHAELVNQNQTMRYVMVLSEQVGGGNANYSVNRVFRNDVELSVSNLGVVTGGTTRDGDSVTDIANKMRVYVYAGGTAAENQIFPVTQTPAAATTRTGELTANTSMEGLVYAIFEINYDPEASLFDLGVITVDLENDVTNPADVLVDYLTNNRYGAGLAGGALDTDSFDAFRDYCDDQVSREDNTGTQITAPRWRLNGGLSTFDTALENITLICQSSSAWFTYDPALGKYSVKINGQATQGEKDNAFQFDDRNIVSKVDVSTTELYSLYNQVEAVYQDVNLLDQTNVIYVQTPSNQRKPGEPDNTLRVDYVMINDLPRARNLGNIELRQSRFDKVVRFTAEYSAIQLLSGDLFALSNSNSGFTDKLFRCVRTIEKEDAEGRLLVEVTGIEYDDSIYDHSIDRESNNPAGPGIPIFINNPDLGNIRANAIANIAVGGFQIGQIPPSVIDGLDANLAVLANLDFDFEQLDNDLANLNSNLAVLDSELSNIEGLFPITETSISDNAITTPKIIAGAITTEKMVANTILGDRILVNSLEGDRITVNTLNGDRIIAQTITGNAIIANTLTAANIFAQNVASLSSATGTLFVDTIKTADSNTAQRIEITGIQDDATYALWSGANAKVDANASFYVKHNGDAKFTGRIEAAQLEGPFFDAVPVEGYGNSQINTSNVSWATVGNIYIEIPETIQRPRKPFVSIAVPVFGTGSDGAWVRCQFAIQADNGTYGSFFTVGQEYTQDTTSVGSAAPIAIGSESIGNRGFRVRVQFRAATNGQNAEANRWTGIFMAIPAGTGFSVVDDNTGTTQSSVAANTSILVPPNFDTGWTITP